ncbi:MAG: hypothetical protein ACLP3C_04985 [Mycobacterium sp.]|uniref:hypothetical protein n=1 Tax=Mycobacterium sp. TaxID=1785 RepID=UPI003F954786
MPGRGLAVIEIAPSILSARLRQARRCCLTSNLALVMSVEPGFGAQEFIPSTLHNRLCHSRTSPPHSH